MTTGSPISASSPTPGRTGASGKNEPGAVAHVGIVPPDDPPKNLPPKPYFFDICAGKSPNDTVACNAKALQAIDQARGTEPAGPLKFDLAAFLKLSVPQQLFAIANLERVSRGEPPMAALTTQLDQVAHAGASAGKDPDLTASRLSGGAQVHAWGSNWAGGTESALGTDDGWMYDDGYKGPNGDCTSPTGRGCWGHRDNTLGLWQQNTSGCPAAQSQLMMGAAYASTSSHYVTSFAEIFVAACGAKPTDELFTWPQAQAALAFRATPAKKVGIASTPDGKGTFVVSSAGNVSVTGDAHSVGDLTGQSLPAPIAAIAVDDANGGYWLVGSNGEVFPFGPAPFYGDLRSQQLAEPIVAIAVDKATGGYWLVTSDGAVFTFHAQYRGGTSKRKLAAPIIAMISDPIAAGYWLVGSNGDVFPFGSVKSLGSEAGKHVPGSIVAAAVTKDGLGYWLAGSNGAVYHFGDAVAKGTEAGRHLPAPVTGLAASPNSTGYWLVGATGVVYPFTAP